MAIVSSTWAYFPFVDTDVSSAMQYIKDCRFSICLNDMLTNNQGQRSPKSCSRYTEAMR